MSVRPLTLDDVEAYKALRLRGLQEDPTAFGSSYAEEVDLDFRQRVEPLEGRVTLGAFLDGQLVAVTTLMRETRLKTQHRANIFGVYTAPEARGRGFARALMEAALAAAAGWEGLKLVHLSVTVGNASARGLYRSLGFVTVGVEPAYLHVDGAFLDEEQMVRFL
ncbi:MAG: family N-acetyltransferase [Cyanobacteria bacterium RYN_339]|nr:family N-acetyltransferase [Cyanobacteria bacterium RYN_339]